MVSSSSRSADGDQFSPQAIAALRAALSDHASGAAGGNGRGAEDDTLRAALAALCEEAHALRLGPEAMVIALKSAWAQATREHSSDREAAAAAYSKMLSLCIEMYYESRK